MQNNFLSKKNEQQFNVRWFTQFLNIFNRATFDICGLICGIKRYFVVQKSGNPAKWSKKVNRVLQKFLERCLSQKFFELKNQCLIFHGFAVTITEAKEFQTDKVKLKGETFEAWRKFSRELKRKKKKYECLVWKDCFSIHSWIWLLSIT